MHSLCDFLRICDIVTFPLAQITERSLSNLACMNTAPYRIEDIIARATWQMLTADHMADTYPKQGLM